MQSDDFLSEIDGQFLYFWCKSVDFRVELMDNCCIFDVKMLLIYKIVVEVRCWIATVLCDCGAVDRSLLCGVFWLLYYFLMIRTTLIPCISSHFHNNFTINLQHFYIKSNCCISSIPLGNHQINTFTSRIQELAINFTRTLSDGMT